MLGDVVREARLRKDLTQARLAKLASVSRRHLAALEKGANVSVSILQRVTTALDLTEIQIGSGLRAQFPRMLPRSFTQPAVVAGRIRDRADALRVETAGELRHGEPIDARRKELVTVPPALMETSELIYRLRGSSLHADGLCDGDLLVVEPRTGGASTGELVIARADGRVFIGRWWQKHGRRAILSSGMAEDVVDAEVIGAVNQVLRESSRSHGGFTTETQRAQSGTEEVKTRIPL